LLPGSWTQRSVDIAGVNHARRGHFAQRLPEGVAIGVMFAASVVTGSSKPIGIRTSIMGEATACSPRLRAGATFTAMDWDMAAVLGRGSQVTPSHSDFRDDGGPRPARGKTRPRRLFPPW